jgi:polar amino acid transport system ATP-binding protein
VIQLSFNHLVYLVEAARWTILLSGIAFIGGAMVGLPIALMRVAKSKVLRGLASGYIQLIQGTPLLIVLFLSYFGLGILGYKLDPLVAAGISFTIYAAAFLGEIWRGCIEAVPKTQWEASDCLGLNAFQQYSYVILPQALRIAIPPTVGFMVQIVKNTSLASVIGFVELARARSSTTLPSSRSRSSPPSLPSISCCATRSRSPPARWKGGRMPDAKSPTGESVISVDNVVKEFGPLRVLDGVSLDVTRGQTVAIVGRSGSGKSTLLRCIAGLETVQDGMITVCGHEVGRPGSAARAQLRRDVGMVFQSYNLFPHLNVERNITLALTLVKKQSKEEAKKRAAEVLSMVGLTDKIASYPEQLSGGQQQRVAIARSLALQPQVMLFDEVTSALDPELTAEVLGVMENLAHHGMTMISVTHEMGFARRVADVVVFMHQGKVWETGPTAEVFANPRTAEFKQFVGSEL